MDESKSPSAGHRWAPITDLAPADRSVQNVELPALADVWRETRKQLADRRAVEMFNERLRREWAIETGIIERMYSLDRGVTQVLIEQGIDASLIPNDATDRPELVADIIRDQEVASTPRIRRRHSSGCRSTSSLRGGPPDQLQGA